MKELYRISGKHFVAGLEVNENGICDNCAPILRRWCMNIHIENIKKSCESRSLEIEQLTEKSTTLINDLFVED